MKTLESIIWLTNAKPFFLGKRDKPWNSSKTLSLYWSFLWICFEVCQTLHRIFWEIEYWFKSLGCQIRSTNTKPFFWKSEVKLQTLQNLSPYIDVCRKFVLKSGKNHKSNLLGHGILIQGLRMQNLVDECKTIFLGKQDKLWNSSKTFSLYWNCL